MKNRLLLVLVIHFFVIKDTKFPFYDSKLTSIRPLDLIFSDVWGNPEINSFEGHHYYVIFVDYYTRFRWLFPVKQNSDIQTISSIFKAKIENLIGVKIVYLFRIIGEST